MIQRILQIVNLVLQYRPYKESILSLFLKKKQLLFVAIF